MKTKSEIYPPVVMTREQLNAFRSRHGITTPETSRDPSASAANTPKNWAARLTISGKAELSHDSLVHERLRSVICSGPEGFLANYQHIADTMNSHADLVAALERQAEDMEFFASEVPPSRDECVSMAKAIRAALAKAKGVQS